MNRIKLWTLGVQDMNTALLFYRDRLGFETSVKEIAPGIVIFRNGGTRLALYPLPELAKDIDAADPPQQSCFSGITMAYHAKSEKEADAVMEQVRAAGGTALTEPEHVFWGAGTSPTRTAMYGKPPTAPTGH